MYYFTFNLSLTVNISGDSYSSTGFDYRQGEPSPEKPMGNPTFPGKTSCNGTNWVGYLTTQYNDSVVQTYDLAVGGASLEHRILKSFLVSVTDQVYTIFMPHYGRGFL